MIRSAFSLFFLVLSSFCTAQRIVTAGSALTETVCALGDCAKIVASDRTSLYPPEIQKLPSIGYRTSISAEGIIALKPSLFIAEKDYVEDAVLAQITSAGVPTLVIARTYTFEGTSDLIRQVAKALQKEKAGEQLVEKIKRELAEAKALVKANRPRVLCVFNRDRSSLSMGGNHTFADILPYVGAVSAVNGVDGYKPLNAEALIASNPDFLLMFESGVNSLGGVDGVLAIPGVLQTTAGKKKQVIAMEGIKLSNFGPRLGEAVNELAAQLYSSN